MSTQTAAVHSVQSPLGSLVLAALGVVYGDIGTSPLYAIKETLAGPHPLPVDRLHVLGALSLMFWALLIVVSVKYVVVMMRADNRGEGGSLALLALLHRSVGGDPRLASRVAMLGLFAAALFYGDSVITPAISVLSAVEGLEVAAPQFAMFVEPLTLAILVGLFLIQKSGSAVVGAFFGPVMIVWFVVLAVLGIGGISRAPEVLWALSPHYGVRFFVEEGVTGFLALGSVVLCVTGAEALYADMGHFGRWPIRLAWYGLVWPALVLNYFGQGALLLADPTAIENPFIRLAPDWAALPMVGLATIATIIASQAVISGAFSITRQAIQLGYLPRMDIEHTSEREIGQIYIPFVNWALMVAVIALVLGFKSSSNLASAYGLAVTGTMMITTIMAAILMRQVWGWRGKWVTLVVGVFFVVDGAFLAANTVKIPHGGWFPLVLGAAMYLLLMTWKRGRARLRAAEQDAVPFDAVVGSLKDVARVRGTAIYLAGTTQGVPIALLHNLKHNQVLHDRVVLLTVQIEDVPFVRDENRIRTEVLGHDFHRVIVRYGFMEDPCIPKSLANARRDQLGFFYEPMRTSYFVSRVIVLPKGGSGMAAWREGLFAWMVKAGATAMDFFRLPTNRVVELGANVEL